MPQDLENLEIWLHMLEVIHQDQLMLQRQKNGQYQKQ